MVGVTRGRKIDEDGEVLAQAAWALPFVGSLAVFYSLFLGVHIVLEFFVCNVGIREVEAKIISHSFTNFT